MSKGSSNIDADDLWLEDDRLEAAWQQEAALDGMPPRPRKGWVACPMVWLNCVRQHVRSPNQFFILLVLYRRCYMSRSQTVSLPNSELAAYGISRYAKYRLLRWLQDAGIATAENRNGQATRVTLLWFPLPPAVA
jgi:hypothetical protein